LMTTGVLFDSVVATAGPIPTVDNEKKDLEIIRYIWHL
jgi:hypothetical protein